MLGGGVSWSGHLRDDSAGPRCDIDDAAGLPVSHCWHQRMNRVQNAVEVYVDVLIPTVYFQFIPTPLRYIETGVVDEQIDLPVLRYYGSCCGLDVVGLRDVDRDNIDLFTGLV